VGKRVGLVKLRERLIKHNKRKFPNVNLKLLKEIQEKPTLYFDNNWAVRSVKEDFYRHVLKTGFTEF